MSTVSTKPMTADQLLRRGNIGRCELLYGKLVMMSPTGFGHGEIALRIGRLIGNFVEDHDLGVVLAAETGYLIERDPDLVRAPDASFIREARVPGKDWKKFFPGVPDLAVEVLSPDDSKRQIAEKVNMWLTHGTISVWVADPSSMTITVYRTGQKPERLSMGDELRDDPTLPGYVLPLSKVFKRG
jgi:Uma2 family endonuclease